MNGTANTIHAVETRTIEDSLIHGHDAIGRAEYLLVQLTADLNGSPRDVPCQEDYPNGIVSSADRLAGRIEGLTRDIEQARRRIASTGPEVAKAAPFRAQAMNAERPNY